MSKIKLEYLDSITVRGKNGYGLTIHFCTKTSSSFPIGSEIDTDNFEGLEEINRGGKHIFITDKHKEYLNRMNGMTTNMQGSANICKK